MRVLAAVAVLAFGCGGQGDCDEAAPPTYEQDIAPLLARSCLSCHSAAVRGANRQGAPRENDYDTSAQATAHASAIAMRVSSVSSVMPPRTSSAPPLSRDEQLLVQRWQRCGAR